jgi:hypothetical protein
MSTAASISPRFRSKTLTAALAFLVGSLGAHRFYLFGKRDPYGWAHVLGTLMGIPGVMLLVASERASILGWMLAFFYSPRFSPRSSTGFVPMKNGTRSSTRTRNAKAAPAGRSFSS